MDKRVFHIFNQVRAEDALKEKTGFYLHAEIQKRKNTGRIYKRRIVIAGILALFFLCGWQWNKMYFSPSAYIDIDVNPSIELTLNQFGKVIRSAAYNDDGAAVLDSVSVRYADYHNAVEILLDAMNASGYFEQDSLLSITVQANGSDKESSILAGVREAVSNINETYRFHAMADIFAVTEEVKHCASEHHISPAKYLAIEDLLRVDSTADFEDCKEHSISELQQLAKEHCIKHEDEEHFEEYFEEDGNIPQEGNGCHYEHGGTSHGHHDGE